MQRVSRVQKDFYRVYIACLTKDSGGSPTRDYIMAKRLYGKLEQKGIHTYLAGKCDPDDRTEAIDSAAVLVVAGTSVQSLRACLGSRRVRIAPSDFVPDEAKILGNTLCIAEDFGKIWRKRCKRDVREEILDRL